MCVIDKYIMSTKKKKKKKKNPKKLAKFVCVCTLSLYMCSVCMYVRLSAGTILLLGSSWYRAILLSVPSDYG